MGAENDGERGRRPGWSLAGVGGGGQGQAGSKIQAQESQGRETVDRSASLSHIKFNGANVASVANAGRRCRGGRGRHCNWRCLLPGVLSAAKNPSRTGRRWTDLNFSTCKSFRLPA